MAALDAAIHENTVASIQGVDTKLLIRTDDRWRSRAAWMAGTRPAMTAEAGPSTGIAISANFCLDKIGNLR